MFIAHGEWVRKHARWVMAGILVLLIPGFVALFTTTGSTARRDADMPTIKGKPVNTTEYDNARNSVMAQYIINTGRQLPRTQAFDDTVKQDAVVRMVLLRKAKEWGITVSDSELIQEIRNQAIFFNESKQFDPERYQRFIIFLNNFGISEARFEAIIREELIISHLQGLVASAVKVTPQEVDLAYVPLHEKIWIDLVQYNAASNSLPVTVTDDEARAFYEKNKESYRIPKQVKVRYAYFASSNTEASVKLTDSDIKDFYDRTKTKYAGTNNVPKPLDAVKDQVKADLLKLRADRAAQDRATELTVKLVQEPGAARPDFVKLCSGAGVLPHETGFFGPADKLPGILAGPQFNQTAFSLTADVPFSDPVPSEGGYYVLEFLASKPSEIPPFEQIKTQVVSELKLQKSYDATVKKAQEDAAQVKKLVTAGKTFAAACADLKLKIEPRGPFTLSEEKPELPSAARVQQEALGMETNAISGFIPTDDGGLFFHLKQRKLPEPSEVKSNSMRFAQEVLQRDRQAMFNSWIAAVIRDENVNFGRMRSREQQQPEPEGTPETDTTPDQTQPSTQAPAKS